jgi:GNAT superfamily N-acetyltransferase
MRALPEYQGRGLGGMLLEWGLEKEAILQKKIFLLSSPADKYFVYKVWL